MGLKINGNDINYIKFNQTYIQRIIYNNNEVYYEQGYNVGLLTDTELTDTDFTAFADSFQASTAPVFDIFSRTHLSNEMNEIDYTQALQNCCNANSVIVYYSRFGIDDIKAEILSSILANKNLPFIYLQQYGEVREDVSFYLDRLEQCCVVSVRFYDMVRELMQEIRITGNIDADSRCIYLMEGVGQPEDNPAMKCWKEILENDFNISFDSHVVADNAEAAQTGMEQLLNGDTSIDYIFYLGYNPDTLYGAIIACQTAGITDPKFVILTHDDNFVSDSGVYDVSYALVHYIKPNLLSYSTHAVQQLANGETLNSPTLSGQMQWVKLPV